VSLWFVLVGLAVWAGACAIALALCAAAARGDRQEVACWVAARSGVVPEGARGLRRPRLRDVSERRERRRDTSLR
jgi:hypothetical protein